MGLLLSFLQNERQRWHVAKPRPGRNIVQGPIVRGGGGRQHQRWLMITIALWKRIATGRERMELAMFDELLHKFRPRSAKQNTWYRQAICPGQKDSSTVCGGYLYAVVTPHYRSRYATSKNQTPCHRIRYVTASHRTLHIRHANAIDTLQKRHTYTSYVACLKFA